jgi:ketosteroid isomerase-like protein
VSEQTDAVEAAMEAFKERDFDRLMSFAHPELELQKPNGEELRGPESAREWAESFGYEALDGTAEIEELRESGNQVVALTKFVMTWKENGQVAGEMDGALLFRFRDGKVDRWEPFADREAALGAAGL